jgi:hypothetical protein
MPHDSGRQARDEPYGIPRYREAMALVTQWELEGEEFGWLIPRLYRLWAPPSSPAPAQPPKS